MCTRKNYIFWLCLGMMVGLMISSGYAKNKPGTELKKMVTAQIRDRGITDKKVLRVMETIPRPEFIPEPYRSQHNPFGDHPVPIGEGQTISQPYIVALMSQLLRLKGTEKVLEVGTGSGYHAAILSRLCKEVYTIEILPALAKQSEDTLKRLGYKNVKVKNADGYFGWEEYAPFDGIIVTCAPERIPQQLVSQLKEEGRMVIPVGKYPDQVLYLLVKKAEKTELKAIIPVLFVPMTGEIEKKGKP